MKITFAEDGWSEYLYWQTQDKKTLKRINQLLQSIERDGVLEGIGKPEPLKYGKSGSFSRRIDSANRLIYEVFEDQIIVKDIMNSNDGYTQSANASGIAIIITLPHIASRPAICVLYPVNLSSCRSS